MINGPSRDAYTHAVIQRINPEIRASLTPAQLSAIEAAIEGGHQRKEHPIDVRLGMPLFFVRYYFVFLVGRDRRLGTQRAEAKRQHDISISGILLFLIVGLSPIILLIIFILYALKWALGIDLLPDFHLKDILG